MTNEEKEWWEKRDAGEFLRFLGHPTFDLQCLSEFRPNCWRANVAGPDVKATISVEGAQRRVGIELAMYASDATAKGSIARRRALARKLLRAELATFLPRFPALDRFEFLVDFRRGEEHLRGTDRRRIAQDLADLLGPRFSGPEKDHWFHAVYEPTVFDPYPKLEEWIRFIYAYRGGCPGTDGWFNGGSGFDWPGIEPEQVCNRIHDQHRSNYDLGDVEECWLVVYSTGPGGSAVRPQEMEQRSLSSLQITESVARSGFDRVYFWSQDRNWAQPLGSSSNPGSGTLAQIG